MAATNLPCVDEDRIKSVFSELEKMEVELDDDPLQYGPRQLNGKVSTVRRMLTRCERVFLQNSYDLQLYKRTYRAVSTDFELQMQALIANDPEVRAGRNVRDRDAIATMKLRDQREEIMQIEVGIQDLEMLMTVIKAKRADLRDLQGRLRDQIKLCQEEIGLGSRWGSKPPPGVKAPNLDNAPKIANQALEDIQKLVQSESTGETHLQPGDSAWLAQAEDEDEAAILAKLAKVAAGEDDEEDDEEESSEAVVEEVQPPVVEEKATEPVVVENPPTEVPDIFAEIIADVSTTKTPPPPVTSDVEVDNLFDRLDASPKSLNAPTTLVTEVEDIDSLIDMFGN